MATFDVTVSSSNLARFPPPKPVISLAVVNRKCNGHIAPADTRILYVRSSMLQLFLRLLQHLALEGEEGMPVNQLFQQLGISDANTRHYLLRLMQKDPRVVFSEDSSSVAAAEFERRKALGADEIEDAALVRMLAFVGKARGLGVLSPKLRDAFGERFSAPADKLVTLGVLAKQIVRVGSAGSGTNIYMLPQFMKDFRPAERGMLLGTPSSERTDAYHSFVEQIRRSGSNIVPMSELRIPGGPDDDRKRTMKVKRIIEQGNKDGESREGMPSLRVLTRAELPEDFPVSGRAQNFVELVYSSQAQADRTTQDVRPFGHAATLNETRYQRLEHEVKAAGSRGISGPEAGHLFGVNSEAGTEMLNKFGVAFNLPSAKIREGKAETCRVFPLGLGPEDEPSSSAAGGKPTTKRVSSDATSLVANARREFLLAWVREAGGVARQSRAAAPLRKWEKEEGREFTVDHKTVRRLFDRLHQQGQLRLVRVEIGGKPEDLAVDPHLPDQEAAIQAFVLELASAKKKKKRRNQGAEAAEEGEEEEFEESDESSEYSEYSHEIPVEPTPKKRTRQTAASSPAVTRTEVPLLPPPAKATAVVESDRPQLKLFAAAAAFHCRLIDLLRVSSAYGLVVNMSFSLRSVLETLSVADWLAMFGCPDALRDSVLKFVHGCYSFGTLQQESPALAAELLEGSKSALHKVIATMFLAGVLQPPQHLLSYFSGPPSGADASPDFLSQPFSLSLQTTMGGGAPTNTYSLRHESEVKTYWSMLSRAVQDVARDAASDEQQDEVVAKLRGFLATIDDGFDVLDIPTATPQRVQEPAVVAVVEGTAAVAATPSSSTKPKSRSAKKRPAAGAEPDATEALWEAIGLPPSARKRKRKQSLAASAAPPEQDEAPAPQQRRPRRKTTTALEREGAEAEVEEEAEAGVEEEEEEEEDEEEEEEVEEEALSEPRDEETVDEHVLPSENGTRESRDSFTPSEDWKLLESFLTRFLRLEPKYALPSVLAQEPRQGPESSGNGSHVPRIDGLSTILPRDFRRIDLTMLPRRIPKTILDSFHRPAPQCKRRLGYLLRKFRTPTRVAAFLLASGGLPRDDIATLNTILDEEQLNQRREEKMSPKDLAACARVLQVLTDNKGKQLPSVMTKLMAFEPEHIIRVFREFWCRNWLHYTPTVDSRGRKRRRFDLSDNFYSVLSGPHSRAYKFLDQAEDLAKEEGDEAEGLLQADQLMNCFHRMANGGVQYDIHVVSGDAAAAEADSWENSDGDLASGSGGAETVGGKFTGLVAPQLNRLRVRVEPQPKATPPLQEPPEADPADCPWITVDGEVNEPFLSALRRQVLSILTSQPGSTATQIKANIPNILGEHCDHLLARLVREGIIEAKPVASSATRAVRRNPSASLAEFLAAVATSQGSSPQAPESLRYWIRVDQF